MPVAGALIGVAGSAVLGHQSSQAAKGAAAATKTRPFSGRSAYGTTTYNQNNRTFDVNQANNPFSSLFTVGGNQSLANAFSAPGSAYYGAPPEVIAALQGASNSDPEMQNRLALLRSQASDQNNAEAVSLKDRLFSLGQLGSTSGAAGQEAFLRSKNAQDLGFQQTAADWANQRAQQRFQNAVNATNQGANLAGQQFGQGTTSQNSLSAMFQNLLDQARVGIGAGGGQAAGAAVNAANQPSTGQIIGAGAMPFLQQLVQPSANTGQTLNESPVYNVGH